MYEKEDFILLNQHIMLSFFSGIRNISLINLKDFFWLLTGGK